MVDSSEPLRTSGLPSALPFELRESPSPAPSRQTQRRERVGSVLPPPGRPWPEFTDDHPLRVPVSACLLGVTCGVDGTSYGAPFPHIERLLGLPNVRTVAFCPEDFAFGTPRETPDIHGGTGSDVLDGRARVLSESGQDWTAPMVRAAEAMLPVAQHNRVHLALLTDISAACGTR